MPDEQPVLCVTGDKVALGPLHSRLVPLFERWFNDFEAAATYFQGDLVPGDRTDVEARYNAMLKDCTFAIYERATMRPIGVMHLLNVSHFNRTAEFGIIIGEKEYRGKGYGSEATRLMLDWGFTAMGLHNIMLTVFDYNGRGIGAYTRAGFREFGRRRQAKRLAGVAYDVIYMEALSTEFTGSVLVHKLPVRG